MRIHRWQLRAVFVLAFASFGAAVGAGGGLALALVHSASVPLAVAAGALLGFGSFGMTVAPAASVLDDGETWDDVVITTGGNKIAHRVNDLA